ncbi:MAG: hypothetical protein LBF76_02100 [Holosporales bacterium]|nr:hypothetical protein [Holosporales bacterium]
MRLEANLPEEPLDLMRNKRMKSVTNSWLQTSAYQENPYPTPSYKIERESFDLIQHKKSNAITSLWQISNPYGQYCNYDYLNWAVSNLAQDIRSNKTIYKGNLIEFLDIFYEPSTDNSGKIRGSFSLELQRMRKKGAFEYSFERFKQLLRNAGYQQWELLMDYIREICIDIPHRVGFQILAAETQKVFLPAMNQRPPSPHN